MVFACGWSTQGGLAVDMELDIAKLPHPGRVPALRGDLDNTETTQHAIFKLAVLCIARVFQMHFGM